MPLAEDLRPQKLDEFIGQEKLLGTNESPGVLRKLIGSGNISSMIFWGPPGTGKTTLAQIISNQISAEFLKISAVIDGKDKLRKIIKIAQENRANNRDTILFIDEIHRWNKAQQDALLPYVETGELILIGATTENPSFTVISPLLSRSRVFVFEQHDIDSLEIAIDRGAKHLKVKIRNDAKKFLAEISNGDIRLAQNSLELAVQLSENTKTITKEIVNEATQRFLRYDRQGEEHYNIISAVHKSLRSSNASAAVYWVMRMLEAGDDPLYIARRLVRFASEDIGNANPNALLLANVTYDTCHKIGMPECDVALVQLTEYLANSKKSNSAYIATKLARQDIKKYGNLPVPMHIRNASTQLMKDLDYGKGYEYDPDLKSGKSKQQCLPDKLKGKDYFI